ncbi:hypothetical protein D3C83_205210 [compost metagenome]
MFSNLDSRELAHFIREGERATWPRIDRIKNQTLISRAFEDCLKVLKDRQLERAPGKAVRRPRLLAVR